MTAIFETINAISVSVFGCLLSAAFCGMGKTKKSKLRVLLVSAALLAIDGVVFLAWNVEVFRFAYPLVVHLPLALILCFCTKKRLWPFTSVFLAYLCCQLRRWLALLILAIIGGGELEQEIIEIILTAPLLVALIKYVAPPVSELAESSLSTQVQICVIPILYYAYDYVAIVYNDWLYSGISAVVEFMPFVCCGSFLAFLILSSGQQKKSAALEADRNNLNLQIDQSIHELASLREAQQNAATYRHDLRHHLNFISACVENGEYRAALEYINSIYEVMDASKVVSYCENEAVNLILSSYATKARGARITMDIKAALGQVLGISGADLCVLLSNGLENALNACQLAPEGEKCVISVDLREKGDKVLVQIVNPVFADVPFEDGAPVTKRAGHGVGTRSIMGIAQRYGGLCSFTVADGRFILRVSL